MLKSRNELPMRIFLTPVHGELHVPPGAGGGVLGIAPFRPLSLLNSSYLGGDGNATCMESRLVMERVKIFTDGSLGAETAAIRSLPSLTTDESTSFAETSEGAATPTSANGVLVYERAALAKMLVEAFVAGYRVEVHAIGDAAAEQVLGALDDSEGLIAQFLTDNNLTALIPGGADAAPSRHWRPILTHCQVLGADLIARMAEKGVVANVQPSFVPTGAKHEIKIIFSIFWTFYIYIVWTYHIFRYSWLEFLDMQWVQARIGPRQLEYSYVWKTLLLHTHMDELAESLKADSAAAVSVSRKSASSSAVYVAGGSDAPVESPNPFTGMYDAMFRTNKKRLKLSEADKEEVFKPEECLSFSQALWIYTIGEKMKQKFELLNINKYFLLISCL